MNIMNCLSRLEANNKGLDVKIDMLDAKFDKKITDLDLKIDTKIAALDAKLDKKITALDLKFYKKYDILNANIENNFRYTIGLRGLKSSHPTLNKKSERNLFLVAILHM